MKNDWKGDFFFSFLDASRSHMHKHSPQGDISAAISASSIESFMHLNIYMQLNPKWPATQPLTSLRVWHSDIGGRYWRIRVVTVVL